MAEIGPFLPVDRSWNDAVSLELTKRLPLDSKQYSFFFLRQAPYRSVAEPRLRQF